MLCDAADSKAKAHTFFHRVFVCVRAGACLPPGKMINTLKILVDLQQILRHCVIHAKMQ